MKTALHFLRFLAGVDLPETQVTPAELELLLSFARQSSSAVEIGCFEGSTTVQLAKVVSGPVFAVDPFIAGRLGICWGEWIAKLHVRRANAGNVTFLRGTSARIAASFDSRVELVFIDGDHAYEAVERDWEDWLPKIQPKGWIAMHDAIPAPNSPRVLGSMRFFDRVARHDPRSRLVGSADSLVVFQVSADRLSARYRVHDPLRRRSPPS